MEYKFTHSVVVMGQLAKESSRTPPSEGNPPFEYIDRSLTILGRTSYVHSERMREEFLSQREFIARQIKDVEIKVDERFKEADKKMNGRFKETDRKIEELDRKMDGRFKETDKKIEDVAKNMREYVRMLNQGRL